MLNHLNCNFGNLTSFENIAPNTPILLFNDSKYVALHSAFDGDKWIKFPNNDHIFVCGDIIIRQNEYYYIDDILREVSKSVLGAQTLQELAGLEFTAWTDTPVVILRKLQKNNDGSWRVSDKPIPKYAQIGDKWCYVPTDSITVHNYTQSSQRVQCLDVRQQRPFHWLFTYSDEYNST